MESFRSACAIPMRRKWATDAPANPVARLQRPGRAYLQINMRKHRAFTLVEVMTVMVILGIAAALIVPQIGTRDDLDVSAAARSVMADLLYAQNRAITTQKKHYVEFSSTGYTIFAQDSDALPLYAITNPTTQNQYTVTIGAPNTPFQNVNVSAADFDASPSRTIQFDSLGVPSVYNTALRTATPLVSTGTITLSTTSPVLSASILIDPATGDASTQ
jgi:type II secretion system protein H